MSAFISSKAIYPKKKTYFFLEYFSQSIEFKFVSS